MAKKKTENIKAAPVLRAQGENSGGGQPTPTPEQTGTRTYQIMDPWKDMGTVNLVDVKAVDGEITEVKVNGEPAGGGGGGAVAAVTVINNTAGAINISYPCCIPNQVRGYAQGQVGTIPANARSLLQYILLANGGAYMFVDSEYDTITVTGDITEEDGDIFVTGDGTITVA